jgi:drug/metabolite transporter (DMT)-like permease
MAAISGNARGIQYMLTASALFVANDTLLKFALDELPPFETLFLRGLFCVFWGVPLLARTGNLMHLRRVTDRPVIARSSFDLAAGLGYVVGLKYAALAHLVTLSQLSPVVLLIVAVLFLGVRIGKREMFMVLLACLGALFVAQPGLSGFSPYSLFGIWIALTVAGRELAGRYAHDDVPGLVVACGAAVALTIGGGVVSFAFEDFVVPSLAQLIMIALAALAFNLAQFLLFLSYRVGSLVVVAPFFYSITLWALLAGFAVFGAIPNQLALFGILLILGSGFFMTRLRPRTAL